MKHKVGGVTLNYTFYSGEDHYSDGDIELELLKMIQQNDNVYDILDNDDRWPVLYHFSPVRQNILRWYPFKKDASVLEVGAGCGAITGILSDKCERVVCNDLSKQRSLINAERNKKSNNIEIIVGNFNDVKFNEKFDYITLIGVLEYAAYYTVSRTPFIDFLKNIKRHLKPEGKLLIAIENKYGLKYWAGCNEDHTGVVYDGLEGYESTDSKVRTFSKDALQEIIEQAGFTRMNFYYPFPDYKFPKHIFSDKYLPRNEDLIVSRESYDSQRLITFDETAVFSELIKEKQFPFFSNSFFVEVCLGGDE